MIRLTLTTSLPLAMLLLCGNSPRIQAQSSDTKVTVKDGSIVLRADGLDAGKNWKTSSGELKHRNTKGVLYTLQITEGGADRCGGNSTCGIDASKPWQIQMTYEGETVTISSLSANKGLHLTFSGNIHIDKWQKTANADEREFGHGDGYHIGSIKVNGSATSLCAGQGGCEITLLFRPQ